MAAIREFIACLRQLRDPLHRNDRVGALCRAWGYVFNNQLKGDYYEFGVFEGSSLINSFRMHTQFCRWLERERRCPEKWRRESADRFYGYQARFIGLDTFSGMPDNDESNPTFASGTFPAAIESVSKRCAAVGLSGSRLTLLKGPFAITGPQLLESDFRPAAIINLDCDLYTSAKDALNFAAHLIQDGTVLLSDDFNTYRASPDKGERRALTEFCESNNLILEPWFAYHFCSQAFICHRPGDQ